MIGKMRFRLEIQVETQTSFELSQMKSTFQTIATVWGHVRDVSAREMLYGKQIDDKVTHRATIRYRHDVTTENWILWDGRKFRIRGVKDTQERRRFLILDLEEEFIEGVYSNVS